MFRSRLRRRPGASALIALLALVLATGGTATAAKLIRGKDVQNNSLTGIDVRNGSLALADLSPAARRALGTRSASSAQPGPAGPAGPQGPAGPKGDKGDPGAQGPPGPIEGTPAGGALTGTYPNPQLAPLPGARIEATDPLFVPNLNEQQFPFDVEVYDTGNMHAGQNDHLTVQRAGVYMVTGFLHWGGSGTKRRQVKIVVNGATRAVVDEVTPDDGIAQQVTYLGRLEVGDQITMGTFNGNNAVVPAGDYSGMNDAALAAQMLSP